MFLITVRVLHSGSRGRVQGSDPGVGSRGRTLQTQNQGSRPLHSQTKYVLQHGGVHCSDRGFELQACPGKRVHDACHLGGDTSIEEHLPSNPSFLKAFRDLGDSPSIVCWSPQVNLWHTGLFVLKEVGQHFTNPGQLPSQFMKSISFLLPR